MGITSLGIGSGLDVESIVSKLVSLEKQPLASLMSKQAAINTQLSLVGQIQSQVSSLADAASKLTLDSSWNGRTLTSSNSNAVTGTVTSSAAPTSFSVEVQQLAKAQSTASSAVSVGATIGTGTLNIDIGSWNYTAVPPTFTSGGASTVSVSVVAGDTISTVATKINAANAGVTATVLRDASGERLLVRSNSTGEASGFRIQVTGDGDGNNTDSAGVSSLAFDPASGSFGMGANAYQKAQNTQATINGVAVTSANQTLADAIPGATLQFNDVTTSPVTVTVANDQAAIKKNINDFIAAYNALNKTLGDATKYDPDTKTGGAFQGDSVIVGLQNALRRMAGSSSTGSTFSHLSDIGIQMQRGGMLTLAGDKLDTALKDIDNLKKLFTADNANAAINGFGLKFKSFASGLLNVGGAVTNETSSLQSALKRNSQEQDKVNARAAQVEKKLRAQYSALDAQMASMSSLGNYVSQQISQWNKSGG